MKLVYRRKFDAAHQLNNPKKDALWNNDTYGPCGRTHGHTWWVEFTLCGKVNVDSGMLVNFTILKGLIDRFDHKVVNDIVELPTAENLVGYFVNELIGLDLFTYVKVKVWESDHAYAEDEWGNN